MNFLINISLRNLLRQKRRNLFLGIGIGFGMMILVIANSFSNGLIDVLFNDVIAYTNGHVAINRTEGGKSTSIIRDKNRVLELIKKSSDKIVSIDENVETFGSFVGNGESDNMVLVGIRNNPDTFTTFARVVDGSVENFHSDKFKYPILISPVKAKKLNVKVGDFLRTKVQMITGQTQAVQLKIVGFIKANNSMMDMVIFIDIDKLKDILGYKPWETGGFQITLKDPKINAKPLADKVHALFKPKLLSLTGSVLTDKYRVIPFKNDKNLKNEFINKINIIKGTESEYTSKSSVIISEDLANKLNLKIDDKFDFNYMTKYRGAHKESLKVKAIFKSDELFKKDYIIINSELVYKFYNTHLPLEESNNYIDQNNSLYRYLALENQLFDRTDNSDDRNKKLRESRRKKSTIGKIDVATMYEFADKIIMMEYVLNSITFLVVIILFFIILIGVINTLRMSIKERTKEIGTLRAIGMQAKDVRNTFILESLFLSAISCSLSILLGIGIIKVLSTLNFNPDGAFALILKDGHINFLINPSQIFFNLILILLITVVTAFFPAKKASNLITADALRK